MINTNEWTQEIPIIFQALSNMLLHIMSWLIFLITLITLQMARVRLTEIISFIYSTNIYRNSTMYQILFWIQGSDSKQNRQKYVPSRSLHCNTGEQEGQELKKHCILDIDKCYGKN